MRNSSVTDKRSRLLSPWALGGAAVAVVGLLGFIFKGEEVFMPDGKQPDLVQASYAELLLQAHPDNESLRMNLIELLIKLGDYAKARLYLVDANNTEVREAPFYRLELDLLDALAQPEGIPAEQHDELVARLRRLDLNTLSDERLQRLAQHALALNVPALAATAYDDLAVRQPQRRNEWQTEAARWYLASNQPQKAASLYLRLAADPELQAARHENLQQAFYSLLAADHSEQAAELMVRHLADIENTDADIAWLESAVRTAQGALRFDLAEDLLAHWYSLRPNDPVALKLDFGLQLASGDIHKAWGIGRTVDAQDSAWLEQMALLGEWTGHPVEALDYYIARLRQNEDPARREYAWRLASMLFDFDRAIPLLGEIADQRMLSDTELDALVYGHESRGTPEQAETWLRAYVKRHPQHKLAWLRLQQNLENTLQYKAESEVWGELNQHFPLTIEQRLDWAAVYWRMYDLAGAWRVLDDVDHAKVRSVKYWRLRAAVAWALERDDDAQKSYERLLALDGKLFSNEEEQLTLIYTQVAPEKALGLMVANWRRTGEPRKLVNALQIAEQLREWGLVRELLAEAARRPEVNVEAQVFASRGFQAERDGHLDEAEKLYQQGLARYPMDNTFRQRLLWFYVDHGRRDALVSVVPQWRQIARADSRMWLAFASAQQMLNNQAEALGWYQRYLQVNPDDWLVQAAYADALETAGRGDSAMRLRRYLLPRLKEGLGTATPEEYATYLRLVTVSISPMAARAEARTARPVGGGALQVWFEQFLDHLDQVNQEGVKSEWLGWAHQRGLKISQYEQIQDVLRRNSRDEIERLLVGSGLDPAQRVEALERLGHGSDALGEGLSAMGDEQPEATQRQLLRQVVALDQAHPQGMQISPLKQDFGGLDFRGVQLHMARSLGSDWYAEVTLSEGRYSGESLDASVLGTERNLLLKAERELADGSLGLTLDSSLRRDKDRNGFGLSRTWELDSRTALEVALDYQRETDDSGLMRALGRRDGLSLSGSHGLTPRDQLVWSLAHRRYSTRQGEDLGNGEAMNVELNHAIFFEGPAWTVRSGLDYQHNRPTGLLDERLLATREIANDDGDDFIESLGGPLRIEEARASDLLQSRYGQLYVGTTLRRGLPGSLNRERPQYTWLVDLMTGWQWTDNTINYGINVGLGMEVIGDDELAFTFGYQSAPRGGNGEPGGVLGMTYSTRFGR
ncbi:tetratricopeptide repeat protein [Pseudomonas sp. LRF_L74]|uniref:tetratricopeptide repeat protein n=1 Tax=Pseudomonas sp. LRF_L74 TaxID=3369422 RepID=UPI003F620220